jgi:serine/threonine protein kinase
VALKLIRRSAFPEEMLENLLARFEREAKSLARLSHPNIVKVHDYGDHDGAPYLVLEFCTGGDLRQFMQDKPMDWREALRLILPIARALRFSHQQGIIHRDVKPSNILFTSSGEPMLSDFGIAKILDYTEAATLTGTGIGIGTPGYMAPEQWTGQTNQQSDQYGLAVVLYEMLAGRKPYEADTPAAILLKQASQPLSSLHQFAPDVPSSVEIALLKALDKDPAQRYPDMDAFIRTFEGLLAESGEQSTPVVNVAPPAAKPGPTVIEKTRAATPPTVAQKTTSSPAASIPKGLIWTAIVLGMVCIVGIGLALIGGTLFQSSLAAVRSTATPTFTPTQLPTPTKIPTPTASVKQPTFLSPDETNTALSSAKQFEDRANEKYSNAQLNTVPITLIYTIELSKSETLLWAWGWCAKDKATLKDNMGKLGVQFTLNGQDVPLDKFLKMDYPSNGLECTAYFLGLKNWAIGEHHATTTVTFKSKLNDGTADYLAGRQIFKYIITVKP